MATQFAMDKGRAINSSEIIANRADPVDHLFW